MYNTLITNVFAACVNILLWLARLLGTTYEAVNVWIFCVIWPLITLGLLGAVVYQGKQLQQMRTSKPISQKKAKLPITVRGDGTSLWCTKEESAKEFVITEMNTRPCVNSDEPYELVLHGPDTQWVQYTDKGIARAVNELFLPFVQELHPKYKIEKLMWSEQGMQPQDGWSFDIYAVKK